MQNSPPAPSSEEAQRATATGPCELADATKKTKHERLEVLSILVRTARTEQEMKCLRAFLAHHFPEVIEQRPPPSRADGLDEWWGTVGRQTAGADFGRDRFVVLPKPPGSIDDPRALRLLSPILCPSAECGGDARAFLMEAEGHMEPLGMLETLEVQADDAEINSRPAPSDAQQEANCEVSARAEPARRRAGEWMACVTELVPRVTRVPRNDFHLPSTGTLSVIESGY